MKYKLTDETIEYRGRTLYRIQALKSFKDISEGDYGGYVESEENLSQNGDCWINDNAIVFGNAEICDDAKVYGNAEVYENAIVYGSADVYGSAEVYENAKVYGNAEVYENAKVYGSARVYEVAKVYGDAVVHGNALISRVAKVLESMKINSGNVILDLSEDLKENIRCQTGLGVFNNKVIAYKQVNEDLTSFYDGDFQYVVGEIAVAIDVAESNESCAGGLHFSNMNYWNWSEDVLYSTFLMAEIDLDDIVTVQNGKIRCRKAKILGAYSIGE